VEAVTTLGRIIQTLMQDIAHGIDNALNHWGF
jgi:hypothetical protein